MQQDNSYKDQAKEQIKGIFYKPMNASLVGANVALLYNDEKEIKKYKTLCDPLYNRMNDYLNAVDSCTTDEEIQKILNNVSLNP